MTGIMMSHAAIAAQAGASGGGGGGGEFVSGNMTVGNGGFGNSEYGWNQPESYGSVTFADFPTGPTYRIYYEPAPTPLTIISFFDGTYGATVVDGTLGTIDGETSVTVTIDGVTEIGTLIANTSSCKLEFVGDVFSLQTNNGQTLAVTMVAGSAPAAADVSGTITVGFNNDFGTRYGYSTGFLTYGSISATPAAIPFFFTDVSTYTRVQFNGTTIGTTPTDSMMGTATGVTSLSVTVDGITQTLTTGGPSAGGYSIAGDPFGFATKNGQTLSLAINLL